jgi:hypothetical protein
MTGFTERFAHRNVVATVDDSAANKAVSASSNRRLLDEVAMAGGCSHPIRLNGDFVNTATGEVNHRKLLVSCKDRRVVVCPSCSYLYKADAWIVVSTGLIGGKGVPESVGSHPRLFVTLTAPSFGPVHTLRTDGTCHPRPTTRCPHGHAMACSMKHDEGSPIVGSPLCAQCFDYRHAILWNAESSRLWNRTFEQVRRRLAISQGLQLEDLHHHARISYLKVAEFQRRGLVHFHAIFPADGPGNPYCPPPAFLTPTLLTELIADVVGDYAITGTDGEPLSWGRQFQISDASVLQRDDLRIAAYLTKYAVKTTDGSLDLAYRFHRRADIRALEIANHRKTLALTTWDLALEPEFFNLKLRQHAHTFGFRGQLITKSRYFSTRFQDLRDARASYMGSDESDDPVAGTFHYEGRGYDDARASQLAEVLHQMTLEVRSITRSMNADSEGGRK